MGRGGGGELITEGTYNRQFTVYDKASMQK